MHDTTTGVYSFNLILLRKLLSVFPIKGSFGFNMLEMLIMLMITGIITAVGTLAWSNGRNQAIASSAASTVRSMIQEGRFQAIRQNSPVAVYLEGNDTLILESDGCNNTADNIIRQIAVDESEANISLNWNNGGGVVWQPNGLAETCAGSLPAQTIQVLLDGQEEESLSITGVAARVRIR